MKQLRNHLICVDQGSKNVFSDFDSSGDMWTGKGARERRATVKFSKKFKSSPAVHLMLDMIDADRQTNQRMDLVADSISVSSFDIVFKTWGDTRIARVRAGWMAIGEVRDADDWEVE